MTNVALIGAGRIGRLHANNILRMAEVKIVAVADQDASSAAELAGRTGATLLPAIEAIAHEDVDAVLICSSTDTHVDFCDLAISVGKAVFCEKPLDADTKRAQACAVRARASGIPLMIGFHRRFDPNFARIREIVSRGELGPVEVLSIISRDLAPPSVDYVRRSGGLFRDQMIHDFDLVRFILGEEVNTIHAEGSVLIDPLIGAAGDVDTAVVTMRCASGRLCQITNSRRAAIGGDRRIEVLFAKGSVRVDNRLTGNVEIGDVNGFRYDSVQSNLAERHGPSFYNELAEFFAALREGRPPVPDGEDGVRAQLMADAATLSMQTGLPQKISADV